jgi:CheY-like chemotaxis protein
MKRILLIDKNDLDSSQVSLLLNTQVGDIATQHLRSTYEVQQYFEDRNQSHIARIDLPSLIILDVDFPDAQQGLDVLEKIQSTKSFQQIPIFIFTSNAEKSIVANCYVRGANGYFLKPDGANNFQKSVQMLADRWQNIIQRGFGYNYKAV